MDAHLYVVLARLVLAAHVAIIIFNVAGLVVIPLGAWRGWGFVRIFWWRALHLAILAAVAVQALFARPCFLTLWQSALEERAGESASSAPLIARWLHDLLFWPLPLWFFAVRALCRGLALRAAAVAPGAAAPAHGARRMSDPTRPGRRRGYQRISRLRCSAAAAPTGGATEQGLLTFHPQLCPAVDRRPTPGKAPQPRGFASSTGRTAGRARDNRGSHTVRLRRG
ncbi:MAG TPA: DUF2784 domain-containing protein [Stellaceae bacterium]|nr:DUF2784 domain-containing protein [Stellaceae bacterium]